MKIRVVSCVVAPDDYMVGHKEKPFQGYFTTELEICKLKKTVPQLLRYFTGAVTVQNRLLNTKHTKHTQKNTKR